MSIVSRIVACAVGAAILLAGSAASATQYWVSFSGTMASGADSGLFGAPGDLTGKSFVATYTYRIENGELYYEVPGVVQTAVVDKVSLTIGGSTYVYPTYALMGYFANAEVGALNFNYLMVVDADPLDVESILNTASSSWFQPNLAFDSNAVISAPGGGDFYIHQCCCPSCGSNFPEVQAHGAFITDKVTFSVPEPATWALMIGGFGLVGAALRRRRETFML